MGYILTAAITQAIVALYLLWHDFKKQKAETYLWYLVAMMSAHLLVKFILLEIIEDKLLFDYLITCFSFGYGPLLLFYVLTQKRGAIPSRKEHWLHLTPLFLFTAIYLFVSINYSITGEIELLENYRKFAGLALVFWSIGYYGYLLHFLYSNKQEEEKLNWLKAPLWFNIAPFIGLIGLFFFPISSEVIRYSIYSGMIILIFSILRNTFKNNNRELGDLKIDKKPVIKYEKSGLSDKLAIQYVESLQRLMEEEKPYLNPDLSLPALAEQVGISKHYITEALNNKLQKNFFQFINEYRVEEAKRLIQQAKEHENLLQVAYASGFNSKTTFIKYFKNMVGTTPSKFRNEVKSNNLNT